MDELSWQARLAKSNINILNVEFTNNTRSRATVYYEFMYRPRPGQIKWCKTFTEVTGKPNKDYEEYKYAYEIGPYFALSGEDIFAKLSRETLSLRKELEG